MALVCTKFLEIRKIFITVVCIYMHRLYKHPPPILVTLEENLTKTISLLTQPKKFPKLPLDKSTKALGSFRYSEVKLVN